MPAKAGAAGPSPVKPASSKADAKDPAAELPDSVKAFIVTLNKRLRQRSVHELQTMYATDFPRLADRFYQRSAWPNADVIAHLVEEDENFLLLYREMYYRHLYRNRHVAVTVEDRFDSFQNYQDLFNILLGLRPDAPEFELPTVWLFELVDEFIFQFQNFHAFRHTVRALPESDLKFLREEESTWNAPTVLRFLHALVKKAGVLSQGGAANSAATPAPESKKENVASMFKALGMFALIGIARVNCLLGDYTTALRVLDPIDVNNKRAPFSQVSGANVTLYYYLTLSYLMTGRYADAVKTSQNLLLWSTRNSHDNNVPRPLQKRVDQMYGLLAIASSISPQRLSDTIQSALRERFGDKLQRMQKGDTQAFEEVFVASAPKYVDPSTPAYLASAATGPIPAKPAAAPSAAAAAKPDAKSAAVATKPEQKAAAASAEVKAEAAKSNLSDEDPATHTQLVGLLRDVKQRAGLPDTVSYLKLCTSINVAKLASFLKTDESHAAQGLLNLKSKTRSLRWRGGPPASGVVGSTAELDIAVSRDVVHISEYKAARRYGEYFIRQVLQLSRLADDIAQIELPKN